jgi:hypothetical protein
MNRAQHVHVLLLRVGIERRHDAPRAEALHRDDGPALTADDERRTFPRSFL